MERIIKPTDIKGRVFASASKSVMHRVLICAALSDQPTVIYCNGTSKDIQATIACLRSMSAVAEEVKDTDTQRIVEGYKIYPINKSMGGILDCGESGSTLRFLISVNAALGADTTFTGHGRLMKRPINELLDELAVHGAVINREEECITVAGKLAPGRYHLSGKTSSQYISGLLMALPLLCGESSICLTAEPESSSYIDITMKVLRQFGVIVDRSDNNEYKIQGRYHSPGRYVVEGDWSNAAFWLVAGAIASERGISVTGLDMNSVQGDKRIIDILKCMGADIDIVYNGDTAEITVKKSKLKGAEADVNDIPDLVPILAVAAAMAEKETRLSNTARLRHKESDRVEATVNLIKSLGGDAYAGDNEIIISGNGGLTGGTVDSFNDHRIAMSAAIAALGCKKPVKITGAEAVEKSYPDFYDILKDLI